MSKFQSDVATSRELVRALFVDAKGVPLEGLRETVEDAYRAPDELLQIASDYDARKKFTQEALDRAGRLAIWKTITDFGRWLRFVAELQGARVVIRDIEQLKRAVEAEFQLMQDDAREMGITSDKVSIFENVKSVESKRVGNGMTVRVELH